MSYIQLVALIIVILNLLVRIFKNRPQRRVHFADQVNTFGPSEEQEVITCLENSDVCILMLYSRGCGHCHNMMPEYDSLISKYQNSEKYQVIKHEPNMSDQNSIFRNGYNEMPPIRGVPTIYKFIDGGYYDEYTPQSNSLPFRSSDSIDLFLAGE